MSKLLRLLVILEFSSVSVLAAAGAVIHGKVIDQSTGEPLRKVLVSLRSSDRQTVTDDNGSYRLENVSSGKYLLYVSTIGYRLLKREIDVRDGEVQEIDFRLGQEASTVSATIEVTAPVFEEVEKAAASQQTLNGTELKNLAGVLVDDPLRSVQTLPGVATGDDFQAFYSVRGGSFQNNGLVVDGVQTHNLVHTIQGTQEPTGSITILNGDLVESIALFSGAFSAKYGDRTASYLEVVTREGSRDATRSRLVVSGSNAALIAEGPLDQARKGSWIVSARKSYADYLVRRLGPESDLNLGFADAQAKLTCDLSEKHRLGTALTWGSAVLERNPANRGVTSLIDGQNNVGVGNFFWTLAPDARTFWENRLYIIRETFLNRNKSSEILDRGEYTELAVKSSLSYRLSRRHHLEGGVLIRFVENHILDRRYDFSLRQFLEFDAVRSRYRQDAFYVQDRWAVVPGALTALLGARVERMELTGQTAVNPRASLEWKFGEGHRIDAGWGMFTQFPEALAVLGRNGDPRLHAEVARHYVLGYEKLLRKDARFRVEIYDKEEADLHRRPNTLFRLVNGQVIFPNVNFRYDNALRGHSRGFEVFCQRRSANRLAGWISYAYENSRRRDLGTGETYSGDFEQRHTVNLYGSYRLTETYNLSVKVRFGSGFPYPGYFVKQGSNFFLSTERNRERLPHYGRADVRLNKAFFFTRSKLSLYIEILNILNRDNIRYEQTFGVNPSTRSVSLGHDSLLPILPTAGFTLEF